MRARRGSAAVEFALCLPVVLAILAFIIDWGMWFEAERVVQYAARECTRAGVGAITGEDYGAKAEARAAEAIGSASGLFASGSTIVGTPVVNVALSGADPNAFLSCEITAPYTAPMGLIGGIIIAPPATLRAELTMRVEEQP